MLFSGVARGGVVLCDYDLRCEEKFDRSIVPSLLSKVPQNITETTLPVNNQNTILMHVLVESPFTYLCIADECFSKQRAYQFLREIKQQFFARGLYQRAKTAGAYTMRNEFYLTLKNEMLNSSNSRLTENERMSSGEQCWFI